MLKLEAAANEQHQRFVTRVVAGREVWGLKSDNGWCTAPSNHQADRLVMPFWSHRAYAARCAKAEWDCYEPTQIPLELFLLRWLPGMHRDLLLVGTNWDANLCGDEVEAQVLNAEIERASLAARTTTPNRE